MNFKLYSELFEHSAFPVFLLSPYGKVRYKNPAANKYLPRLRKNADASKYLQPSAIPKKSGVLQIAGSTSYHRGLALIEGEEVLVLCFSFLQYDDGVEMGEAFLNRFGDTAFDFLCEMHRETRKYILSPPQKNQTRLYTDMLSFLQYEGILGKRPLYDFIKAAEMLFTKLKTSFSALGYRISTQISEELPTQKDVLFSMHDFLFIFGKLLYLQMRLAAKGEVSVTLTSDGNAYLIRFLIRTRAELGSCDDILSFFTAHIPECASEIMLLERTDLFDDNTIRFEQGAFARFMTEYRIPYTERNPHILRSVDISELLIAEDIRILIERIEQRLKDIGASY
ncbi:MAG: hypothetical protein IJ489_00150 [Clostridia bacterium]|nr:hypothetical protein [Clostridia bacterium]